MKEYTFSPGTILDAKGVDGQVVHFNANGTSWNLLRDGLEGQDYILSYNSSYIWAESGWRSIQPPESPIVYTHIRRAFASFDISEIPLTATVITAHVYIRFSLSTARDMYAVEWQGDKSRITNDTWGEINIAKVYDIMPSSVWASTSHDFALNPLDVMAQLGGFFGMAMLSEDDYRNIEPNSLTDMLYKLGCVENDEVDFEARLVVTTDEVEAVDTQLIMII